MRAERSSGIVPRACGSGSDEETTSSRTSAPSTPSGAESAITAFTLAADEEAASAVRVRLPSVRSTAASQSSRT
jgi:hypothetical protein